MAKLPLEGIRVLDFTRVWALPWGSMMLGDMGAEVICVESRQHYPRLTRGIFQHIPKELFAMMADSLGCLGRGFPDMDPGERQWDRHEIWVGKHRNQLSCTMDLTRPEGYEVFKRLVKVSDAIIENNNPDVMEKLGVTWEAMKEINPRLIYVRSAGYGLTGPYRGFSGLGMIFETWVGHTELWGYSDSDSSTNTASFPADAAAGASALFAFMLGLRHRERTGKGMCIDLGQGENFLPHLCEAFMDYSMNRRVQTRTGNRHPSAIQGCYLAKGEPRPSRERIVSWNPAVENRIEPGKDNWVVISIENDEQWEGFCRAIGNPPWTKEVRFLDCISRLKNHDELDRLIEEWTSQRDKHEIFHLLQKDGVPCGVVMNDKDAYEDPHLKERSYWVKYWHREAGTREYPGLVWRMSKTPGAIRYGAPCLGEHNEHVYKKIIGVSDEEYEKLVKEEHIGDTYVV